jgi:hypothetical protein
VRSVDGLVRGVDKPSLTSRDATEKCRERERNVLSLDEGMKRCARTGGIFKHRSLSEALYFRSVF